MRSVKTKAPKSAAQKSSKSEMTAEALERLIAERAGAPVCHVGVRGSGTAWQAFAVTRNSERRAKITIAAYELRELRAESVAGSQTKKSPSREAGAR